MILVSSCLLGLSCRYDGQAKPNQKVMDFLKGKHYMPVCPEQMGGLSTPRIPCEIVSEDPVRIETEAGDDLTNAFLKGVSEVEKLIEGQAIECAILKAKSPSCGSRYIYDGSFSGRLVKGQGVLSRYLQSQDIKIWNEAHFERDA